MERGYCTAGVGLRIVRSDKNAIVKQRVSVVPRWLSLAQLPELRPRSNAWSAASFNPKIVQRLFTCQQFLTS